MPPPVSSPGLPRIWALGISRLQRAFAELIPAYSHLAEFRIVGRAYDSAADAIARGPRRQA